VTIPSPHPEEIRTNAHRDPQHAGPLACSGSDPYVITEPISNGSRAPYTCPECGHALRVSGLGRHRVYFEPDDRRAEHPVMNRICPGCAHGLPGKNPL
jgi:hypothetical protein